MNVLLLLAYLSKVDASKAPLFELLYWVVGMYLLVEVFCAFWLVFTYEVAECWLPYIMRDVRVLEISYKSLRIIYNNFGSVNSC